MKIHIRTYGCQMNERDSEAVAALLIQRGHTLTDSEDEADVVLINTCSVRAKAEEKALGKLGLLVAGRREFPGRLVGAMGCMVQRMGDDILKRVRGLDFAVGTHRLGLVPDIMAAARQGDGPVVDTGWTAEPSALSDHMPGGVSAYVNILHGCDRRCTYCVVPRVRGPEWSRPAARVIEEVRALVAGGVREVTLLGQSVMSYGRRNGVWDPDVISPTGYREPFPMLLEAVDGIRGLARLRFTSGHPSGCTEELARAMRDLTSVCEHIHLPLQSGSDRILQRMGREYTADAYRAAVARLKAAVPDLTVTTDIIVGFPSETLAEFEMTRQFMEEIGFDNAFIFKYSSRPETPAAEWEDDVPWDEKQRRNRVLLEDQDRRALAANRALIGGDVEILVEGRSRREPSRWSGRTRADKIAAFEPDAGLKPGDLRKVRVERATAQTLFGRLI